MKDGKTPRDQEGPSPTKRGKETAERREEQADGQPGEANPARTERKARDASGDGKSRGVHFGG
jgi:hypothetical protein